MRNVLVAGPYTREELRELSDLANLFWLSEMGPEELESTLPNIDVLFVHFWPKELDARRVRMMTSLVFVQTGLAGVNHIPLAELSPKVEVSSNAGGYSGGVGEFAWALVMAAAKGVVMSHKRSSEKNYGASPLELGKKVRILNGKTIGILGYGGIGRSVGRLAMGSGMKVLALSRKRVEDAGVTSLTGANGLDGMLRESDSVVIAAPLNKSTRGMIGRAELGKMKKDAVLVNVGRAEIVDQQAVYEHLLKNKDFVYATDVWWTKDGKEAIPPELPFFELDNFIGTPHISGPSALAAGQPLPAARGNLLRYLRGEKFGNVVDRSDYV